MQLHPGEAYVVRYALPKVVKLKKQLPELYVESDKDQSHK